jgi:hypothetical protein
MEIFFFVFFDPYEKISPSSESSSSSSSIGAAEA